MDTKDVIKHRRKVLGLSLPELAYRVGLDPRTISRYEAGTHQPLLPQALLIADALDVSLRTLAGEGAPDRDVSGPHFSAWQTYMNGIPRVEVERLVIKQDGEHLHITGEADPTHTDTGSYPWEAEGRLLNGRDLVCWYTATSNGISSCGTLQMVFSTHGSIALGTWAGHSHDGISERGWGALAGTENLAIAALDAIKDTTGTLVTFPDLSYLEFPQAADD